MLRAPASPARGAMDGDAQAARSARGPGGPERMSGDGARATPKPRVGQNSAPHPTSIRPQHKHPRAAVLPRGTKTLKPASMAARRAHRLRRPSLDTFPEEGSPMVAARRNLLREIRRLAVRDELRAMRTRGRLVVPPAVLPPQAPSSADCPAPRDRPERK